MQTHVGYACPIVSGVVDINLLLYNIQYKRKHICSHDTIASSELARPNSRILVITIYNW